VRWGSLRTAAPISRVFGFDRGTPIDRCYIEKFLGVNALDIRGRVLEVADNSYTRRFGADRVTESDILHAEAGNSAATIVGDLESGEGIPPGVFDCIVLTQTLNVVYEIRAAVGTVFRALKPGGVVLATVPGISQISRYDMDRWGDYWRFTSLSARKLFAEAFGEANVTVASYGNVLSAIAFIEGIAVEELRKQELDYYDRDYEVLIGIKARKAE
jgi:SAM-dependent methyltransferase